MAVEQRIDEETYQRLVFSEPDIGKNLELLLSHYTPGPWQSIQREFH